MRALAFLIVLLAAAPVSALDVHVAPGGSGDGTEVSPFGTVDDALAAAGSGDVVWLHEGYYGDVTLSGDGVTVAAAEGEEARLRTLTIGDAVSTRGGCGRRSGGSKV